ncbi:MAG: hypothetical protein M1158_04075 [Candidatus Marsarchaeota archaeon]|jgi:hypothetical protein|nr:hypothetical protein [Candidatus Marsarchaeota archaeon]
MVERAKKKVDSYTKNSQILTIFFILAIISISLRIYSYSVYVLQIIFSLIFLVIAICLFYKFLKGITTEKLKFRFKVILLVLLSSFIIAASSIGINSSQQVIDICGDLVIASTISILIGLEFYKDSKNYILNIKTKDKEKLKEEIDMAFFPIVYTVIALFFIVSALMYSAYPGDIMLMDLSIMLMLLGISAPIELLYERLLVKMTYFKKIKAKV